LAVDVESGDPGWSEDYLRDVVGVNEMVEKG
jgi:hypothetical protein